MLYLCSSTIDENRLKQTVCDNRAGAVATFEGRVRDHNEGKPVIALMYEACESLAEREAERIIAEAKENFAIINVAFQHRTGEIKIGELAVFVAVSAAHRDDAFRACRYIIDQAKVRLAIWKKETYSDGNSVWVNCQTCAKHTEPAGDSQKSMTRSHR